MRIMEPAHFSYKAGECKVKLIKWNSPVLDCPNAYVKQMHGLLSAHGVLWDALLGLPPLRYPVLCFQSLGSPQPLPHLTIPHLPSEDLQSSGGGGREGKGSRPILLGHMEEFQWHPFLFFILSWFCETWPVWLDKVAVSPSSAQPL